MGGTREDFRQLQAQLHHRGWPGLLKSPGGLNHAFFRAEDYLVFLGTVSSPSAQWAMVTVPSGLGVTEMA